MFNVISPTQNDRRIFPSDTDLVDTTPKCWICGKYNDEVSLSLCSRDFGVHHIGYKIKWENAYKEKCRGSNELHSFICFDCAH